ncbi:hypothetical protein, partial [Halomonas alkalisoli]|uniref:hypothetical protein n=1 Tax=Halomonas alkalisoli TaxID=2907158 RepID=UPI001F1DF487
MGATLCGAIAAQRHWRVIRQVGGYRQGAYRRQSRWGPALQQLFCRALVVAADRSLFQQRFQAFGTQDALGP